MAQYIMDLFYSLTNCMYCFPGSPNLKINNKTYKLLRLLGEGGFSYVYLVQDTATGALFALKKIRCPFGQESVARALRECEAYALFAGHPNVIRALDHAVVDARDRADPGAKTVYVVLPYYRRGNLQDAINANLVNRTRFPERRLVALFVGIARGLKALHQYRVRAGSAARARDGRDGRLEGRRGAGALRQEAMVADADAARRVGGGAETGDAEQAPLMETDLVQSQEGVAEGELRAYAHRDVKPGNIMIDDDGTTPILMDLGSLAPSPTPVTSRAAALAVQDAAAEHSTMPYRAPELFDVKTGTSIDAAVDVWSLGATLYACLVGRSPFEARSEETGGSLSLCVLGGDWRFPDERRAKPAPRQGEPQAPSGGPEAASGGAAAAEHVISEPVKEVVRRCLRVEPAERPDVDELIAMLERVLGELPEDDDDGA